MTNSTTTNDVDPRIDGTLAERLVAWAWSVDGDALPDAVVATLRRHIADGLGCAIAAVRMEAAGPATRTARRDGAGPTAIPGTALSLPVPAAAFLTGVLIHALDYDDTHADGLVHVTAPVLPAALAVGQSVGASGVQVLAAAAAGYEAQCRMGAAVRHGFHRRGFHATAVCGTIAAALIAARLLGLDQRRAVHALGIAGSFAAGSLEFLADGSSTKQLHPGWAAQSGVRAAWLAADGATGPATILEGERGLYRLFTDGDHSAASIVAGLGQRWELLRITLKPYPACQLVHAALDATADLGLDADDLGRAAGVTVEVPPDAVDVVCEPADAKRRPRTPYDAKFSLHWAVATMLHDSAVTPASFTPEAITRPAVARLADLVRYTVTDHRVAAAAAPSTVEIDLGGEVRAASVPASRGGPDRPLTDADVRRKLTANVGHAARAGAIMDAVTGLPDARDLSVLTDAMVDSERRVVA